MLAGMRIGIDATEIPASTARTLATGAAAYYMTKVWDVGCGHPPGMQ
jgi:hypothetical protein